MAVIKVRTNQQKDDVKSTLSSSSSSSSSVWSDIPRRLFTICVGVPAIWKLLQQPTLAYVFFMGAHALCIWEFTLLEPSSTSSNHKRPSLISRVGVSITSVVLASSVPNNDTIFFLMLVLTAGTFVMMQRRHWLTGLLLLTIPFRSWAQIQLRYDDAFINSVSLLLVVWNADTGAMLMGRIAGIAIRTYPSLNRLPMPQWILQISPKKSMEGFLGGILGGVWTAVQWIPAIVHWASPPSRSDTFDIIWLTSSWRQRAVLGVVLSLLAIIGDLTESSIKRQSQAKDSGSILPGHGGILDRFDSSLLAVLFYQVIYCWIEETKTKL
ncbi:CDP-diglyceride synthetase [Nitzschia inconspicua]|uniref:Phosphatidate cytidylyltransferase n=1 Tax=Nitzschia inconspicua TaxID=303405 RepID=A0A9K3P9F4_9STRA|nr:CDP-diglyceride synthetase [Nitzschia inconspicua]KAG7342784.1 CDP-diglyceride synthetase [Nitzschia inconspicua]